MADEMKFEVKPVRNGKGMNVYLPKHIVELASEAIQEDDLMAEVRIVDGELLIKVGAANGKG